jgi:dethiobiotin synthetase
LFRFFIAGMNKIFITGIGTDVGKTIVSAIVVEALKADYWKPVQAGELEFSDSDKIRSLISNDRSRIFKNSYALKTPMSPHAAAAIDGITIELDKIIIPDTLNNIVIEGAGGLLVPLNEKDTILDIIENDYKIIVVSRHYLGSINHTLLTIETLRNQGFEISGIIFSGIENETTENIIEKLSEVLILGRIDEEEIFNKEVVKRYANSFKQVLENL